MPTKTELDFLKRFGAKTVDRPRFNQGYTINLNDQAYFMSVDGEALATVKTPDCDIVPRIFDLYGWLEEEQFQEGSWKWMQEIVPNILGKTYDNHITISADNLKTALQSTDKLSWVVTLLFLSDNLMVINHPDNIQRNEQILDEIPISRYDTKSSFKKIMTKSSYLLGFLRSLKLGATMTIARDTPDPYEKPIRYTSGKFTMYVVNRESF